MQMSIVGKEISRLTKANTASGSLRATIPKRIVTELGLGVGDIVDWELFTDKNVKYARMKKLD